MNIFLLYLSILIVIIYYCDIILSFIQIKSYNNKVNLSLYSIKKSKSNKKEIIINNQPEFSRIVNVAQIPAHKSVLCKLLANEFERKQLSNRLDLAGLNYLSANVTLSRQDSNTIIIEGSLSAIVYNGDLFPVDEFNCEFDTVLLDNTSSNNINYVNIDDATDYDDEVKSNGDIDIGEIVSQYLSLELF